MVRKCLASYLVLAVMLFGFVPRVGAGLSPSEAVSAGFASGVSDLETIRSALEQKLVNQKLQDLGFTVEEVQERLTQLSDAQIHDLAMKFDKLRAGGDFGSGMVAVMVVMMVVMAVVFVWMYATGRMGSHH